MNTGKIVAVFDFEPITSYLENDEPAPADPAPPIEIQPITIEPDEELEPVHA